MGIEFGLTNPDSNVAAQTVHKPDPKTVHIVPFTCYSEENREKTNVQSNLFSLKIFVFFSSGSKEQEILKL